MTPGLQRMIQDSPGLFMKYLGTWSSVSQAGYEKCHVRPHKLKLLVCYPHPYTSLFILPQQGFLPWSVVICLQRHRIVIRYHIWSIWSRSIPRVALSLALLIDLFQ